MEHQEPHTLYNITLYPAVSVEVYGLASGPPAECIEDAIEIAGLSDLFDKYDDDYSVKYHGNGGRASVAVETNGKVTHQMTYEEKDGDWIKTQG